MYLIDKYISKDYNSKLLIKRLIDPSFGKTSEHELKFMASQLSPLQHLNVFNEVMNGEIMGIDSKTNKVKFNNLKLSSKNINIFFDTHEFNSIKQNCNHFFWIKIKSASDHTSHFNESLKLFENYYNKNITKHIDNTIKSLQSKLCYFEKGDDENLIKKLIIWLEEKRNNDALCIPSFKKAPKKGKNYNIRVSNDVLSSLYKQLELYDFIEEEKTSEHAFINVLKEDWSNNESEKINLKMDHLQTKLLLDGVKNELGIKIRLSDIEKAKNIFNNNGAIKASSISSSSSKSFLSPKQSSTILGLIKKVKI
jgi:acyl carrier protein